MTSSPPDQLLELHSHIDEIDADIITLLARRFAETNKVGLLKASAGITAVDAQREEIQMLRYANLATKHDLNEILVQTIFRAVISEAVCNHRDISEKIAQ
jgi:chorismate mutase